MLDYSEINTNTDSKFDFLTGWIQNGYKDSIKIAKNISDDDLREKLKQAVKAYQMVVSDNLEHISDYEDDIEDFLLTNELFFAESVDNVDDYIFTSAWNSKTNEFTVIDIDDVNDSIIAIDENDEEYPDKYDCQDLYSVIEPIMKDIVNIIIKNTNDKNSDFIFNSDKLVKAITKSELQNCRELFVDYIKKVRESLIKYLNDKNISEMSDTAGSGEF